MDEDLYKYISVSSPNIEVQFMSVKFGGSKKMFIANCYRPPSGSTVDFCSYLHDSLDQRAHLDEFEVYICGDLNIPHNDTTSADFRKLKELENKYSLTQTISIPTRHMAHSSSILDLILTNSRFIALAGSYEINIGDHEPVFVIRKKAKIKIDRVDFRCRCFTGLVKEDFQRYLITRDWDSFYQLSDVDELWDHLNSVILRVADPHCPMKVH